MPKCHNIKDPAAVYRGHPSMRYKWMSRPFRCMQRVLLCYIATRMEPDIQCANAGFAAEVAPPGVFLPCSNGCDHMHNVSNGYIQKHWQHTPSPTPYSCCIKLPGCAAICNYQVRRSGCLYDITPIIHSKLAYRAKSGRTYISKSLHSKRSVTHVLSV